MYEVTIAFIFPIRPFYRIANCTQNWVRQRNKTAWRIQSAGDFIRLHSGRQRTQPAGGFHYSTYLLSFDLPAFRCIRRATEPATDL